VIVAASLPAALVTVALVPDNVKALLAPTTNVPALPPAAANVTPATVALVPEATVKPLPPTVVELPPRVTTAPLAKVIVSVGTKASATSPVVTVPFNVSAFVAVNTLANVTFS